MYQLSIVSLLEPFSDSDHLLNYMVQLNMENVENNFNGKIWLFWSSDIDYTILYKDEKHITFSIKQMNCKLNWLFPLCMQNSKITLQGPLG